MRAAAQERSPTACRWSAALLAGCALASAALAQQPMDWLDQVYRTAPPAEMVETLLDALGDPRWSVRDSATRWLSLAGPELLEPLRARYHQTLSQEVRVRIRHVAREVFMRDRLGVAGGFIGVRMATGSVPAGIIKERQVLGIRVMPMQHTAADEAGIRANDVIVKLDGEPLEGSLRDARAVANAFGRRIRQHQPGDDIILTVLRDGKLLNLKVTLMPRPILMEQRNEFGQLNPAYQVAEEDFRSFWTEHFSVHQATGLPQNAAATDEPD